MTDEKEIIGRRIRQLRRQQSRTLQEIADTCGFTRSLLSKIETGKVYPPIATLVKIAGALGTTVAALVEDAQDVSAVFTAKSKADRGTARTEKGYFVYPFAAEYGHKKMQPFLFVAKRNEVKRHRLSHQGEEFVYVIQGEMKFRVGEVEYRMVAGDGLYFNALETHEVIPLTERVKYLDVFV
jgi:transcriptional regulator with XRE-family HTH domain